MRNILERASKTFLEAFIGYIVITLPATDYSNLNLLKGVLIGGVATGISAILNLVLNYLDTKKVSV